MLILASESPRRRELLKKLGAEFEICPAAIDELEEGEDVETLPEKNALLKAQAVAERFPEAFVLGADTGVFDGKRMLGKPRSAEDARNMLLSLSGKRVLVWCAFPIAECVSLTLSIIFLVITLKNATAHGTK